MKVKIKKLQLEKIVMYLWMLLLIIDCFSIYYKIAGYRITQVANIIITFIILLISKPFTLKTRKQNAYVLLYILLSFTFLILICDYKYVGFITGTVIPMVMFFCFFCINLTYNKIKWVLFCFENLILIIAGISLLFYILGTVYKFILPTSIYSASYVGWSDWNYNSYYGLYFEGHRTYFFGRTIIRNIGIFLEAPVFAYVLVLAIYIEMFLRKNTRKLSLMLLAFTIITTFSTTAIALTLILVFIYVYLNYMRYSWLKLLLPIVVIAVFFVVLTVILDKLAAGNDSGTDRMCDFIACWRAFAAHPLVGIGFNNVSGVDPYRDIFKGNRLGGMSSGIPFVFANGGIVHAMIYIFPMLIGGFNSMRKEKHLEYALEGFICIQTVLLFIIIVEYTLLAQFFLAMEWALAINWKKCMNS